MDRHPQNDWRTVRYDVRFDVYWVPAGGAQQQLFFCPWCGEHLPPSQRDRWFDTLEAMGIDPTGSLSLATFSRVPGVALLRCRYQPVNAGPSKADT